MSLEISLWAEGKQVALEQAQKREEEATRELERVQANLTQGRFRAVDWWRHNSARFRFLEGVVLKATMRLAEKLHPKDYLWEERIVGLIEREQNDAVKRGVMRPEQRYKTRSIQRAFRKVMERSKNHEFGPLLIHRTQDRSIVVTTHG